MPIDTDFASTKPYMTPSRVGTIQQLQAQARLTRSEGDLTMQFAFPHSKLLHFFYEYDALEQARIKEDITGVRSYTVRNMPENIIGRTEYHRLGKKIIFGLEGAIKLECEDVWGEKRDFMLTSQQGIILPPFILHTYFTKTNPSGFQVLCNTLFDPDTPRDTYSAEAFRKLQEHYR